MKMGTLLRKGSTLNSALIIIGQTVLVDATLLATTTLRTYELTNCLLLH